LYDEKTPTRKGLIFETFEQGIYLKLVGEGKEEQGGSGFQADRKEGGEETVQHISMDMAESPNPWWVYHKTTRTGERRGKKGGKELEKRREKED